MHSFLKNPHLAVTLTAFFWAGNAIAGRYAIGHISPMALTLSRWALATALLAPFAIPHIKKDWPLIKQNFVYLALCGAVGYMAFNFFLYSALQHLPAVEVTLEQTAMPIIIFVLNYLLYRTGVTWLQLVGYGITIIGVVVIVSKGNPVGLFAGKSTLGIGDFFMLLAALCYGGYSVALAKKPAMHWMSFLFCLVAAATVAACFAVTFETAQGATQWPTTIQGVAVAVYAGLFPSLVAQGLFIYGVERLGPNMAGLYINMVPVFAAFMAVFFLGEKLFAFHAVAFILVVGGLMVAQHAKKGPPNDGPSEADASGS